MHIWIVPLSGLEMDDIKAGVHGIACNPISLCPDLSISYMTSGETKFEASYNFVELF